MSLFQLKLVKFCLTWPFAASSHLVVGSSFFHSTGLKTLAEAWDSRRDYGISEDQHIFVSFNELFIYGTRGRLQRLFKGFPSSPLRRKQMPFDVSNIILMAFAKTQLNGRRMTKNTRNLFESEWKFFYEILKSSSRIYEDNTHSNKIQPNHNHPRKS